MNEAQGELLYAVSRVVDAFDSLGIEVQEQQLNREYLVEWARKLGLRDFLKKALAEAGSEGNSV